MFRIESIARTILLLPLVGVAACASLDSVSPDATSAIAVCGGGLDRQVTAKVEAAYENLRGSAIAEVRERIGGILNTDNASAEKYRAYLECVVEVHERYLDMRACPLRCQSLNESCESETKRRFDRCIAQEIKGCISHCKQFRIWSTAECVANMCNWASMSKEAKDFHTQRCELREGYIDNVAECSSTYGECLAEC